MTDLWLAFLKIVTLVVRLGEVEGVETMRGEQDTLLWAYDVLNDVLYLRYSSLDPTFGPEKKLQVRRFLETFLFAQKQLTPNRKKGVTPFDNPN